MNHIDVSREDVALRWETPDGEAEIRRGWDWRSRVPVYVVCHARRNPTSDHIQTMWFPLVASFSSPSFVRALSVARHMLPWSPEGRRP